MVYRVLIGAGLFFLGYYVGRQAGISEPIRKELEQQRKDKEGSFEQASSEVDTSRD